MAIELKGKKAIVTGASRGIGAAIAGALAGHGVDMVISGRDRQALEEKAARLSDLGASVHIVIADLEDPAAPERIISKAVTEFGGLDILINNAGMAKSVAFADSTFADWETHLAVNARAPFFLCQGAAPFLQKSRTGSIVNIASVVASKGYEHQAVYAASKHALAGFTKVMAKELQSMGIRVFTLSPGGVATDLVTAVRPDIDVDQLIQPDEIADLVIFLLTRSGKAMIDEIRIRRESKTAWL